jgi:hypothetical protein
LKCQSGINKSTEIVSIHAFVFYWQVDAGFNDKTGCYEIRTLKKYKKYDQVFISYGCHDSYHLLVEYGFTLPDNPNDAVAMDFGMSEGMGKRHV